ncbi:MAG: SDR family NAD(P)-dependent oxidoreductase [Pirellulales bacterium]
MSGAAVAIDVGGEERLAIVHEIERTQRRGLNVDEIAAQVRAAVAKHHDLDTYAVALLKTGSLPRTSSGKIQRAACRAGLMAGTLETVAIWSQGPLAMQSAPAVASATLPSESAAASKKAPSAPAAATAPVAGNPIAAVPGPLSGEIQEWLVARLAQQLAVPPETIDRSVPFEQFALDSKDAIGLSGELEDYLHRRLSPTLFYEYPTIESLSKYLATVAPSPAKTAAALPTTVDAPRNGHAVAPQPVAKNAPPATSALKSEPAQARSNSTRPWETDLSILEQLAERSEAMAASVAEQSAQLRQAIESVRAIRTRSEQPASSTPEPIAVIGVGCRLPGGVTGPDTFWKLLNDGLDAVAETPADRWDVDGLYDPDSSKPGKMSTRWGGFVPDVDKFDAKFFGISPREAVSMDPQQRMFLEVSWEALEHAGQAPDKLYGSQTGVFLGICASDYAQHMQNVADPTRIDPYTGTGSAFSVASGRLSYALGLQGPNMAVDTACSSSLVAVHLAVQSLRSRESNVALAGGVNMLLSPEAMIYFSKVQAMAADGRCKTFDAAANGYVRGEGCGVVVLKRLSDALEAGDRVLAVIRGSAVNHDGRSNGLTAPNGHAQEAVIRQALSNGGVAPADVQYIEAHGTGTALGDPIEARALGAVFGPDRRPGQRLVVGSVKTNIGHLEAAAGIAGLIKVVLSLRHQKIPGHLHFQKINPLISLDEIPIEIATAKDWLAGHRRRLAGISSFGFGGTNAHVVLEEAPTVPLPPDYVDRPLHVLTLSSKTPAALSALAERYESHLQQSDAALADICYSANVGRAQLPHRVALVSGSVTGLRGLLHDYRQGKSSPGIKNGQLRGRGRPKVAFLFTGQGAQYVGMGRELFETQPTFRATLLACDEILHPLLCQSLIEVLYPADGVRSPIDETAFAQPALFALEYALAQLWRSWGVEPAAVMGHSVGEYAAACAAGLFSLEDGLSLIAERGRLMQSLPGGARMAAVMADPQRVATMIKAHAGQVSIAAVNGPDSVVISGAGHEIEALLEEFAFAGVPTQPLVVSHAFHSPLLDPILPRLEEAAGKLNYRELKIPLVSNRNGQFADTTDMAAPEYWRRHAREPVQFSAGIATLHAAGIELFVEIGPSPTLSGMARRCQPDVQSLWLPSLRKGRSCWQQMLDTLAALYAAGADVDWSGVDRDYPRRKVSLPTYPFQRERYWLEKSPASSAARVEAAPTLPATAHYKVERNGHAALSPATVEESPETQQPRAAHFDLDALATDYVREHQVFGRTILPGAGFLSLALAAAERAWPGAAIELERVRIARALTFPTTSPRRTLCYNLKLKNQETASFQAVTRGEEVDGEVAHDSRAESLHAQGKLRFHPNGATDLSPTINVDELRHGLTEETAGEVLYRQFAARQISLGPVFQWLERAWRKGDAVVAQLRRPAASPHDPALPVPPGLLDACFQLLGVTLAQTPDDRRTFVPVRVERLRLFTPLPAELWGHASIRDGQAIGEGRLTGDVTLCDAAGRVVLQVEGVSLLAVEQSSLVGEEQPNLEQWLHTVVWEERPRAASQRTAKKTGDWLVLADDAGCAAAIQAACAERGEECVLVRPGSEFGVTPDHYVVNPAQPDDFKRLLEAAFTSQGKACRGVVHLWPLLDPPADATSSEQIRAAQTLGTAAALHALQAVLRNSAVGRPEFWLVTRGTQSTGATQAACHVAQSPLWGLGRVMALEHPELSTVCVDLDPSSQDWSPLLAELASPDGENQIAWRNGKRLVARLTSAEKSGSASAADDPNLRIIPAGQPYRLEIPQRGVIDNLAVNSLQRQQPGQNQIEIEVRATGLNFRDVLNVLNLYPGDPGHLGGECSGRVTAIGEGVTHLAVGDEVLAIAPGSFGSHVITHASLAAKKPAGWSFEQAAGVPIAFLTVHYGFNRVAEMKPGERVLIHAATGGVGLAAVQVAQRAGAEIFATAGSSAKRDYLRSLGIKHVMDSRSTAFADEIMRITDGRGVDIVLNSLAGDTIPKSLSVLAPGGRFVELGKTDVWDATRVAELKPGVTYTPIALDHLAAERPEFVGMLLAELLVDFQAGALQPVRDRAFDMAHVVSAFRHMAQAKHMGKVIVSHPVAGAAAQPAPKPSLRLQPDVSYLITGGLGSLGLLVARWAVEHGARCVILSGRSAPSAAAQAAIREIEQIGALVVCVQADVATAADARRLVDYSIDNGLPKLAGIIHAAGVLDDGVLIQQTWDRFQKVFAPKVAGAWNLHEASRDKPLDFFVLFSSVASLLGSPGQGNYAAANAFQDALAQHRRALGLPANSVQWGPWTAGMAAGRQREAERWQAMGITPLDGASGLAALEHLLHGPAAAQVGVLPIDWRRWAQIFTGGRRALPLLANLLPADAASGSAVQAHQRRPVRDELLLLRAEDRPQRMEDYLRKQVARALELQPEELDIHQPINTLGFDSLMAVEVKNRLEMDLGIQFNLASFLEGPTIHELAPVVLRLLTSETAAAAQTSHDPQELLQGLDAMSDEEVAALLDQMIAE